MIDYTNNKEFLGRIDDLDSNLFETDEEPLDYSFSKEEEEWFQELLEEEFNK
jgi:hypothetical protein